MSQEQVIAWIETVKKILNTGKLFIPADWAKVIFIVDKIISILNDEATVNLILAIVHFFDKQEDAKKLKVALLGA